MESRIPEVIIIFSFKLNLTQCINSLRLMFQINFLLHDLDTHHGPQLRRQYYLEGRSIPILEYINAEKIAMFFPVNKMTSVEDVSRWLNFTLNPDADVSHNFVSLYKQAS